MWLHSLEDQGCEQNGYFLGRINTRVPLVRSYTDLASVVKYYPDLIYLVFADADVILADNYMKIICI